VGEMEFEFCPELQASWFLKKVSFYSLQEVKVTVVESSGDEYPSSIGRHLKDVRSYPAIFHEKRETDFYFKDCVYFNIRDESSPGYAEDDEGEGTTFQRLITSELVNIHKDRGIMDRVVHYRIICCDEVIDAVCNTPPDIVNR
jgi:hypothetical protein